MRSGGGLSMTWYISSSKEDLQAPTVKTPKISDIYIHTNLVTHLEQAWMYLGELEGWLDISGAYQADDGTIEHPQLPQCVLTRRTDNRDPTFVLRKTFDLKQKGKAKADARSNGE